MNSKISYSNPDNCPFCGPVPTVLEDLYFKVFYSIKPQSETHLLITPKKHMETIDQIHWNKLLSLVEQLKLMYNIDSYTLKMNFNPPRQEVMHSHLHFLAGRCIK